MVLPTGTYLPYTYTYDEKTMSDHQLFKVYVPLLYLI